MILRNIRHLRDEYSSVRTRYIAGMLAFRVARQFVSSCHCQRIPTAIRFLRTQASMSTDHCAEVSEETYDRRESAKLIPPLHANLHKGAMGKVVVVGGCEEYTGAPYFAAFAALKMGADLAHVFCTKGAASVIKSYSPELIVHPYLDECSSASAVMTRFEPWMDKFSKDGTCVVIGPGLGRHPKILEQAKEILLAFNGKGVPVVVDADGLWMLCEAPDIVKKLQLEHVVLTPNPAEHVRMLSAKIGECDTDATVVLKGKSSIGFGVSTREDPSSERRVLPMDKSRDWIVYSNVEERVKATDWEGYLGEYEPLYCEEPGSSRRAGGQGDILTGCIATFIAWNSGRDGWIQRKPARSFESLGEPSRQQDEEKQKLDRRELRMETIAKCAHAGCTVTRMASIRAFNTHHRAMGAPEIINELGSVIHDLERSLFM